MNDPSCVMSSNLLVDEVMGYISHPKVLSSWILGSYHTMQSEVRYCIMYCEVWIYKFLLVSMLNSTIFCALIPVKNAWYNHIMDTSVVYFIISVDPLCIISSIFHRDVEFINKKVGNIFWVFEFTIFVNSHTFACMLFIF